MAHDVNRLRARVPGLREGAAHFDGPGGTQVPDEVAEHIRNGALASIRWPAGGQYFGNWVEGERLAQNGRGMTWTDPSAETRNKGGNCYN